MRKIIVSLMYRFWLLKMYKLSCDGQWLIAGKSVVDQEKQNLIESGYHPDEITISIKFMSQYQYDQLPEFDGFC